MTRVVPQAIGIVTASLLASLPVHAQSADRPDADVLADLRACATLERDGARLACFDGVLAAQGNGESRRRADPGTATRSPATTRTEAIGERAAPREAPDARAARPEQAAAPRDEQAERAARPEPVRDDRDELGADRTVTIVAIEETRSGATFLTETGERYVQTSGGALRSHPDVPYETTLRDGALGSLFLYVTDRRRVRVRKAE